jgi:DNA-binding transcriptional LysR family regulator
MSPRLVEVERELGRICAVELTDVGPLRPVGLMWRSNEELSPIAARFAKVLRQVAQGSSA